MRVETLTVSVGSDLYVNRNVIIIVNECTMPLSNVMGLFWIEIASVQWIHATTLTPATVPTTAKQIRSHNNDKEQRHCAYKSVHIKSNIDYGWQNYYDDTRRTHSCACVYYISFNVFLAQLDCSCSLNVRMTWHTPPKSPKNIFIPFRRIFLCKWFESVRVCRRTHCRHGPPTGAITALCRLFASLLFVVRSVWYKPFSLSSIVGCHLSHRKTDDGDDAVDDNMTHCVTNNIHWVLLCIFSLNVYVNVYSSSSTQYIRFRLGWHRVSSSVFV